MDIQDFRENDENMIVEIYTTYDNLPEDVREEFYIFEKLPEGYELSEMRVVTVGQNRECESQFRNSRGQYFIIRQSNSNDNAEVIVNSDYVENWDGIDVYVKNYTNNAEKSNYKFAINNTIVNIMIDNDVNKEEIKEMIKEAIY